MELVAETGGVVCTWPSAYGNRKSLTDWAKEIREIALEIGIEHVGLGTDGGGGVPYLLEDYSSILDLPDLVEAMNEVGFKRREIQAYMGGNLLRVIKQCIG
jgi:microsomal dipeptidase-like Zn-dependent dipeptidase